MLSDGTGYPDARTSMGPAAFGGACAAPIWRQFMSIARGSYCGDFPQPAGPAKPASDDGAVTAR